jgi:GNAT superfamily N-acetyltransferase
VLLLAEEGSALVGMALTEPMRDDDGAGAVIADGGFVGYLYVTPQRWGEGIGGQLLDTIVDDARSQNYRRIRLWTAADNERSHRLYRSRGFKPTGRVVHDEGEWVCEIAFKPPSVLARRTRSDDLPEHWPRQAHSTLEPRREGP